MRRDIRRALNDSERDARPVGRRIGERMGKDIGAGVGRELKIALGGIGVGNLPAVATALTTVAGAIQQVAQTGLVLPGVVATGAASLGTLKFATAGVGDSLKEMWKAASSGDPKDIEKAAEAMKDMEPNAKRAMTAMVGFHGEVKKLQNTARGNVFRDLDGDITRMGNTTLPTLNAGIDKTSRAWNNSFREMLRVGSSSSTQGFLDRIFGNTADAQNKANAAIEPVVHAFGTLAATGSDSVPRLGTAVSDLAKRFDAFATAAGADGRLNKWINDGLTGTTHLGRTVLGVGQVFTGLTKAAGGGEGLLSVLDKGSTALAKIVNSAGGQQKLAQFFAEGREQLHNLLPILQAVPPVLGSIFEVSKQWTSVVLPPISQLAQLLAEHTGLVKTAAEAWLLFKTIPTLIGGVAQRISPLGGILQSFGQQSRTAYNGVRDFGEAYRTMAGYVRQANPQMSTANVHLQTLRSSAGVAAAGGINALKGAASGLTGALGGPWGLAITGAVTAIGLLGAAHEEAARKAEAQRQKELELQGTLDETTGRATEATRTKVKDQLQSKDQYGTSDFGRAQSYGIDKSLLIDAATGTGNPQAFEFLRQQAITRGIQPGLQAINTVGEGGKQVNWTTLSKQFDEAGVSSEELNRALLRQGNSWDEVNRKLQALPPGAGGVHLSLQKLIDLMPSGNESIITLVQNLSQLRTTFADGTQKAVEGTAALNGQFEASQALKDKYAELGAEIVAVPTNKQLTVQIDEGRYLELKAKLEAAGNTVERIPGVNGGPAIVKVTASTDQAQTELSSLVTKIKGSRAELDVLVHFRDPQGREVDRSQLRTPGFVAAVPGETSRPVGGGRADGAIVLARAFGAIAMADGGLRQIRKPRTADIYAGRGAGTIFAEEETGGEAYIPLAPNKRQRSMAILTEVARRFGLTSFADGGITVDELKSFASNIAGNSYNWGGGNGDTFSTDCSGAQSTIANFITGGSGRFATASESSELLKRGFRAGDPPDGVAAYWVGWENGGPGGGHTAGTIVDPDGGNVNVEMGGKKGGGQFGGGAAGASSFPNRAWIALAGGDNGKSTGGSGGGASTSQVMSAQASVRRTKAASAAAQKDLDDANAELNSAPNDKKRKAAEKKRDNAQRRLDAAKDREATANQRLTEVLDKKSKGTDKATGGDNGAQSFGQSLVSGVFEGLGLPGFSNLLEWPNVKSGLALANWGIGYAKSWASAGAEDDQAGAGAAGGGGALGGALSGIGLPNLVPSTEPKNLQPIGAAGTGTGPLPGPAPGGDTWNISGVDPAQIMPKVQALQWPAFQRNLGSRG